MITSQLIDRNSFKKEEILKTREEYIKLRNMINDKVIKSFKASD